MSGAEQSPIDLCDPIPAALGPLQLSWKLGPVHKPNHETILFLDNGFMTLDKVRYKLVKGHMHRPSEHVVNGKPFAMEIHLIHEAESKKLSVVGIFVVASKRKSKAFELLMQDGPGTFDPNTLLPPEGKRQYDRYAGSLTTPPFSEIVTWSVLVTPISAAQNQLELVPEDARELWPQNRRYVLRGG